MAPLPVDAAQAVLTSLGNQARSFYSPTGNPFIDPGGFIASEDPAPIFQRPAKQLARAVCRTWARQSGPSTNPAADRLFAGACGEYLDSIDEGVDPGTIGPPFNGGQCDAVYTINYTLDSNNAGATTGFLQARGPIRGIVRTALNGTTDNVFLQANGVNISGSPNCRAVANTGASNYFLGSAPSTGGSQSRINSVTPCGVDNCGNPPPEYERPRPPITLPPITPIFIDLPDIGEIPVTINILPDATINLCSEDLDTCVTIAPPNDDSGGQDGGVGGDDLVPDGGLSGAPADTGDGGVAAGAAPEGQELVGVRVEVLESPIGVNTYDNVATTVFRGIGYVRMGYSGRLALDMGGSAVISPQFFLAPVRGLTHWEVRANNGFINRVTPFYRELPS